MKKRYFLFLLSAALFPLSNSAQHTFTSGSNSLEIGGYVIAGYQYRPHFKNDPNGNDYSKNTFFLDDARLEIKGYVHGRFRYNLECNFADFIPLAIDGIKAIKSAPVTEANISYINPYINVKAGYMKLPFGASSNMDKIPSPYMQRTFIADGDYYSRRDVGLLLFKDLWHQRINLYAGIYSGMGEQILLGSNDPSGMLEYVGRVQFSSSYYRDEELDMSNLALPVARVAAGVRYSEKNTFTGTGATTFTTDNTKTIDGKKLTYGIDAGFMWHGFSAQFEMAQARLTPHTGSILFNQLALYNTTYYRNGGFLVQANYFSKFLRSAISVRYDEFNPDDLIGGAQMRTLGFAYNFVYKPYGLTLKIHYAYRFKQPNTGIKFKEDMLRIGVQYVF